MPTNSSADDDPFDTLLTLEDQFYNEGYAQGHSDGVRQARLEGRVFGFEQGFSNFLVMGKLQAKARIWEARLKLDVSASQELQGLQPTRKPRLLPPFPQHVNHERLAKHVDVLLALVDPRSLSFQNRDDAVNEFNDRLKRAQAKIKVVEKMIGEENVKKTGGQPPTGRIPDGGGDIESFGGG